MPKRVFDIFCAIIGLIILSPILMFVMVKIKFDSPGPVFFRQERVGRFGYTFRIHKFRTMQVDSQKFGYLTVGEDSRITPFGHVLRKYKLDELPQLIDVLIGKMSLVGPRPEVQEFIDCYPPDVRDKVLSIRPGITDLAAIKMIDENEILAKYDDPRTAYIDVILPIKQGYYLDYIDSQGFIIDIKIIFKTLTKIIYVAIN